MFVISFLPVLQTHHGPVLLQELPQAEEEWHLSENQRRHPQDPRSDRLLDAVLKAGGERGFVGVEVTRPMEPSVVARTIFGFCGQPLSASNYKAKIEQYFEALDATGITEAGITESKQEAQSAAAAFKA